MSHSSNGFQNQIRTCLQEDPNAEGDPLKLLALCKNFVDVRIDLMVV
jgi:hypothetical protein